MKNVLIITFDQMRGDWVDFSNPVIKGLYLNTLAKKGWVAEKCYTSSPQCVPARLSWITGLRPRELGVDKNENIILKEDSPSIIRSFEEEGWETALIGKTHWTPHTKGVDLRENKELLAKLGFKYVVEIGGPRALKDIKCELTDQWEEEGYMDKYKKDLEVRYAKRRTNEAWKVRPTILPNHLYPDIWIANKGIEYLKRLKKGTPWLLWVSFVGPHEPFDTPRNWRRTMRKVIVPKRIETAEWIKEEEGTGNIRNIYEGWKGKITDKEIEDIRIDYKMRIQLLDDQVKRIVSRIKQRGEIEKTDIVITADHGEMLGDHEMLYKSTFLEGAIHVPFIYIPCDKKNRLCRVTTRKPVGLTETLKAVLIDSRKQLRGKRIKENLGKRSIIEIRYDEETCLIKERVKVVFDSKGRILWATDIKQTQSEQENIKKWLRYKRTLRRIKKFYKAKIKERPKREETYIRKID